MPFYSDDEDGCPTEPGGIDQDDDYYEDYSFENDEYEEEDFSWLTEPYDDGTPSGFRYIGPRTTGSARQPPPAGLSHTLVDTSVAMKILLDALLQCKGNLTIESNLSATTPTLFLDLEGVRLSRNGSISLIQLFDSSREHTYLIDVHVLGATAFSTRGSGQLAMSLKDILESATIPKVFFDVRNDSNTLFAYFGVALKNIIDL